MSWPAYFKEQLTAGNMKSPVGVVTLWTLKSIILQKLDQSLYAVTGQLYSKEGINWIIRNTLANPQLRYLVLCGDDRSGGGKALLDFMQDGVNNDHLTRSGARVDKEIGVASLNKMRQNVEIIDMRSVLDGEKVTEKIKTLDLNKPSFGEPKIFPLAKHEDAETFPTDPSVFKLRYPTVAAAWPWILKTIMRFGNKKGTDYGGTQREVLNLCSIVYGENPDKLFFADYFTFNKKEFEDYAPQVLTPEPISGIEYTYGERLRNYDGIDQIKDGVIAELRRNIDSRRALAVTWRVGKDMAGKQPPCIILVQGLVQDGLLHLTAFIRSNDMFRAWPQNTLALRRLQGTVAKETRLKVGTLTTISGSAHIYERDYVAAKEIIKNHAQNFQCDFDPRGNFVIKTENELIKAVYQSPQGAYIKQYAGKTAMEVYLRIDNDLAVSQIGHALDLGFELGKAEMCIKLKKKYVQDCPLYKLF